MDLVLAGRVEAWKASRWSARLAQLRGRNDALADALNAALQRLAQADEEAQEATLRADLSEVCAKRHGACLLMFLSA